VSVVSYTHLPVSSIVNLPSRIKTSLVDLPRLPAYQEYTADVPELSFEPFKRSGAVN
jgi:hypothetical protein